MRGQRLAGFVAVSRLVGRAGRIPFVEGKKNKTSILAMAKYKFVTIHLAEIPLFAFSRDSFHVAS